MYILIFVLLLPLFSYANSDTTKNNIINNYYISGGDVTIYNNSNIYIKESKAKPLLDNVDTYKEFMDNSFPKEEYVTDIAKNDPKTSIYRFPVLLFYGIVVTIILISIIFIIFYTK